VLTLTRPFSNPHGHCVNKWDLNAEMTQQIEEKARRGGASIAGRIRYDNAVTQAQIQKASC